MISISIIIPIYNVERYLARCLDSIIAQGVQPHEVIMVNDGSKDGSKEIALRYADKYLYMRYFEQPNGGVSVARNTGIKHATGEYITFCDPDDYYEPNFLTELTAIVENHDADLYRFGYREIGVQEMWRNDVRGKEWSGEVQIYSRAELYEGHVPEGGMMVWRYLYRRELIELHGISFPPGIVVAEDEIFGFRYMRHIARIADIDSCFYVYDRRETSVTASAYANFNPAAVVSFKANALTLLNEWGEDAPQSVRNCIEGYLFSFTISYISLPHLSKERHTELRRGIKEIGTELKRNGITLKQGWRYTIMYRAFRLYRWLFRTKKKWEAWRLSTR